MDSLKREARCYTQMHFSNEIKEERIIRTIETSKQALLYEESSIVMTYPEFLYQQGSYIKKRWWVLQGLLLLALYYLLQISHSPSYVQRCLGILSTLFVILIMPEFWKNRNTASMEIEGTAFYSLRQIYAARMLLFAMVDVVLLTVFFTSLGIGGKLTIQQIVIEFLIPMFISGGSCFFFLCSRRATSEFEAILFCIVWTFIWVQIVLSQKVYAMLSIPIWGMILFFSMIYFGYSIYRLGNSCEKIWEANPTWN